MLDEATRIAQEQRNAQALIQIASMCGPQHQGLKSLIQKALSELSVRS